jgi:signal peptidase I
MVRNLLGIKKDKKQKKNQNNFFREYFELITETLIYVFFVMTFLVQSFVIPTGSMKNNILIGDHLLVDKIAYSRSIGTIDSIVFPQLEIKRGMIVTFKAPAEMEKEYVKRVIGLPGETIRITNKKVYINEQLIQEPYVRYESIAKNSVTSGDNFPFQEAESLGIIGRASYLPFYINDEIGFVDSKKSTEFHDRFKDYVINVGKVKVFKIPEGHYFCMGDNRDKSYDSRFWGPVPADHIIGKPWRIYWSFDSESLDYLTPGIEHKIKDMASTIVNFFSKTRWNRTLERVD